jgi:hypothetical protein
MTPAGDESEWLTRKERLEPGLATRANVSSRAPGEPLRPCRPTLGRTDWMETPSGRDIWGVIDREC